MEKFVVNIYGSEYNIKADRDGEYVLKLAEIVDQKMREISNLYPQGSTARTAVLTCLNLIDESLRKEEVEVEWLRRRIGALIEKLAIVD
ncbi:MAG: cell division protein ZapA [candidate division WOR-3 bacterium]